MGSPLCAGCRFCEELAEQYVRCRNPDLADEAGWQALYYQQGYLEVPHPEPDGEPCFWFVKKQS